MSLLLLLLRARADSIKGASVVAAVVRRASKRLLYVVVVVAVAAPLSLCVFFTRWLYVCTYLLVWKEALLIDAHTRTAHARTCALRRYEFCSLALVTVAAVVGTEACFLVSC